MNLGELIVELSADSSELEKTLERAKKKAYEAAVAVEKSFENINLNVGVDDDSLVDLNKHLNLKVKHLKEVNKYFNNNPIVVNVDDDSLVDLNKHLNLKVQHLKEVNKYFDSNPIKVNTDIKSLDELEEKLSKLSNKTITITVESELSKQLEKSLVDAVKEAVKDGMEEQSSATQQQTVKEAPSSGKTQNVNVVASPSRAILDGIFEGLGKGFTNGINRSIEDAVGVDIPTMTRISSNMFLRYFGVGKKAQSDPRNERKRVEAIVTDGVNTFVKAHEANVKSAYAGSNTSPSTTTLASRKTVIAASRKTAVMSANKTSNYQSILDDDIDVDFEATGRVASKGLLRFFGIGKKAQSDPKEEKARVEAILKGMVDDYIESQTSTRPSAAGQFLAEINNEFANGIERSLGNIAQKAKSATISAVKNGSQTILANSSQKVQNAVNGVFASLEGTESGSTSIGQIVGNKLTSAAKQSLKSTAKTILPNTYNVVSEFLGTGTVKPPKPKVIPITPETEIKQAAANLENATKGLNEYIAKINNISTESGLNQSAINLENAAQSLTNAANEYMIKMNSISTESGLNQSAISLENAAQSLTNAANTLTNSAVNIKQEVASQVSTEQPLNIPLSIPQKPEPELVPVENNTSKIPLQLKQHIEAIQSSTSKNIELSRQYAEATANENGNELVPQKPINIEKINTKKQISLDGTRDVFKIINNYFDEEYTKLKADVDRAKKSGNLEDINATRNKLKNFASYSEKAIADIDAIVKQAEDQGYEKYINSELTDIHSTGKAPIRKKTKSANHVIGSLNYAEQQILEKQRKDYVAQAEKAGIEIPEGLKKGIVSNFEGVSTETKKLLNNFIKVVKDQLGIQSPSWVMFEIGMMIASGLFLGMQKGNSQVAVGARQLVSTVKDAVGSAKEILEPALAIGGIIPGVSTAATYGSVGLAATDSGLKMLDKVGERHAANPEQTLFQSAFESGKDFVTELRADKTLTKPREAFDHFINLSKAGAATFGVNSFTAFDAAQSGMTALLRSGAIGKAVAQSHGETKSRLTEDPSLDYMATYKAVLTDKLKDLKLTKPEIIKAIGSALKVVPTGFGTAANSVAETAGMVFADGIDALTIPRDLYRNISAKTVKGATHQQAIAESIADLGAPAQIADTIGSFGDKHSASLNTFARMSGNVVENINRTLINTVAASSKVVSSSTNAVSNQVKKNMGHLPSQQPINQLSSQNVSSAAVASNNVSAKPFTSIGGNIMKGLGKGIADSIGSVTKVMDNAGNAVQSQIKQNMGISSPSKVMIALGLMIASGLAIGIKKGAVDISGTLDGITGMVIGKMKNIQSLPSQDIESFQQATLNASSQNSELTQKVYDESKGVSKPTAFGSVIGTIMMGLANSGLTPKNIETPLRHLGAFYQGTAQVHKLNSALAREAEIATIFNMMQSAEKEGYLPDGGFVNMVKHENLPTLAHTLGGFNYTQTKDGGLQINDVYDWHNSSETDKNTPFSLPGNLGKKIYSVLDKNQWLVNLLGLETNDFGGAKAYSKYDHNTGRELFSFLDKDKHDFQLGHSVHSSVIGGSPYIQTHNLNKEEFDSLIDLAEKPYLKSKSIKGNPNLKSFLEHPEVSKYIKGAQSSDEGGIKKFVSAVKKDFGEGSQIKKILDGIFDPLSSQLSKQYDEYYQQIDQQESSGDYKNRVTAQDVFDKLENPNNDMTQESVLSLMSAHRRAGMTGDIETQSKLHNILLAQLKANNPNSESIGDKINKIKNLFSNEANLKDTAVNLISSFGKGILASSGGVLGIVITFAKTILSAIKKVFKIASPSGEGIDIGENIAGSTGTGIDNQAHQAVEAARNMAEDIREAMIPDPWDMRLPVNPAFQQDLDLESQAQAHIKATKEYFQKSMIQDLLAGVGVNFGSDFNHEGIASSVLSSSQLMGYLNSNFASLNPLQQNVFGRLAADFDNQKTNAAHQFAIAQADGTTIDSATIRGFDRSFNATLNRIVEFSKRLGIKSTEIDRLLTSNQSKVATEIYQPPRFVAPKTSIPERQPGQTDQEYSQLVKRTLAEDNNNYRKAKNAYNRMILGIGDTPVPQRTQLPMLPPVPVYAREINAATDIPYQSPISTPTVSSVIPKQSLTNTIADQLQSTIDLQQVGNTWTAFTRQQKSFKDIFIKQLQTQLPSPTVPIAKSQPQLLLPPAKAYADINLLLTSTQSNLQRLAEDVVARQPRAQLPPQQAVSPLILPNPRVGNPNSRVILPQTSGINPNAQIISPRNVAANPNAQIILPVVQGLVPAVRSTHSLAQNSINALMAANKQIRVNLDALRSGDKNLVFSRYVPIPDPWLTSSPTSQASRQSTTLPPATLSFISQNPPTAAPSHSVPTVRQNTRKPTVNLSSPLPRTKNQVSLTYWTCNVCLTDNLESAHPTICQACGTPRSQTAKTFIKSPKQTTQTLPQPTASSTASQPPNIPPVPPTTASSSQPPQVPPSLIDQYLGLGTDLVTNMFKAVNTSIRQSTLSGYASLGQVMRNAVNAALFSLASTLNKPLHQALLSQTRSILPWFMKFIPRSFQLLPKLSFAVPFIGGIALRFGNAIIRNLLENNILKEGGFLTNLLSSITKINLPSLSGTKTAGVTGFLKSITSPVPMFVGSNFNPLLSLGLGAASPLYDAFGGILGLDNSMKPNPKKQALTVEEVLQEQTKANRKKAQLRDVKGTDVNINSVQNLSAIPDIQRTKTEELLKRAVESGKAIPKLDELTRKALRERGVRKFVRDNMDSNDLLAERENILKNPLNVTNKERDFLLYMADIKKVSAVTAKEREKKLVSILKERGKTDQEIENIRLSDYGHGLSNFGDDLLNNLPTSAKQTNTTGQKSKLPDPKVSAASKELIENLGNTLIDNVLDSLDIPIIPKSVVQGLGGRKLGERSATIASTLDALGIQKSKVEQSLEKTVQSGKTGIREQTLTKQALRQRGVRESVRNAMTPDELVAARDNILNNPLDVTKRERDLLQYLGDMDTHEKRIGADAARKKRDSMIIRVLGERGLSGTEIRTLKRSNNKQGFDDFATNLVNNPRTSTKGFVGKLTEAYAANDQDAMKELVKQGLRKAGMSAKQINNIDPQLLDTATAGLMTTLTGLQSKFKEKGFDMGKALAKGFKDSMVNLANAKDDLEYNAKKALGQANFGDSVGLIFRRMFRGTAATQDQFKEMYDQMGSGVKKLMFKNPKEGDEIFPNVLQFMGSLATTFAPITTMVGAITPLLLPLAPIITGIGMAVNMVAPHVAKLIDGIQRVEVLQRRFQFLGGSKEGGIAEFKYAKDIANKMNVPSEVAANSYSQIAIAAKDSKMEGQGVKDLFEGITSSLSALGISGQDASLVFTAYTQILAKGKLSMEELRQQLGEKFPPAMAVFAKAMGVSIPEMNALVASGSVLSQDILPKVAKVLKEDYGNAAANQAGGLVVALNRLGNVGFEITSIFADKLGGTLAFFVNTFANTLGLLTGALGELIPLAQSFMIGFAATISIGLTIILSRFGPLKVAITSLQNFLLATFGAITTNMMPMVIGIVSDVADGWMGAEKNLMDNMFQGVNNMIVTVFGTIDSIMRSMSNNEVSFGTIFGGLIQGAKEAGNIIEWLKGIFAVFFKAIPSGFIELLAMVFMFQQGTGLMVMALGPALKGLWGAFTGMVGVAWGAFQGVMGSLQGLNELMMTSSAAAGVAADKSDVLKIRSAALRATLVFLTTALTHFAIAYAILMFSKGDFSDPLRESMNKTTADINKQLTDVRSNINKTTEAFNNTTKSVAKLGNTITNALPAKGVQLDIRSLWGGGDYKWDNAVRDTNERTRGNLAPGVMDFLGPVALGLGGAGVGIAAKAAAAGVASAAATAISAFESGALATSAATSIGIMPRILAMLAPMLASPLAPWIAAVVGFIAAIGLATVALNTFAPQLTQKQLDFIKGETDAEGNKITDGSGLTLTTTINAKKVGERLDHASQQVLKAAIDDQLNTKRLKEFLNTYGLTGKVDDYIAPLLTKMTDTQKENFKSDPSTVKIDKEIANVKASLRRIEEEAEDNTEAAISRQKAKPTYTTTKKQLTELEKNRDLMQYAYMANANNEDKKKEIDGKIKDKEKEIRKAIEYNTGPEPVATYDDDTIKLQQELEKLQKDKAQFQSSIDATAQRRVNFNAIQKFNKQLEKVASDYINVDQQLQIKPSDALRAQRGKLKEEVKRLQKEIEKEKSEFGSPLASLKQSLKLAQEDAAKIAADPSPEMTPEIRASRLAQNKARQEQLKKSISVAEKFDPPDLSQALYTKASTALADAETRLDVNLSKNKIVSNQAQAKLYGTTLTSQQIAPDLSARQIADLNFQQKELQASIKTKQESLMQLRQAELLNVSNTADIQERIQKLEQDLRKDREQVSQNSLEIVKAQREARQALIDQTKQVAEYYRTSLRESQAAAIEFDKATNNIKSQQFATKLKQALIGAGNNLYTNFIEGVIGLFQQLTEIENLRLDQRKQKLDYQNSIQDIQLKVTEMQRSLPGKIVPFSVDQIGKFNNELKNVDNSVSGINKEINSVTKALGVNAVNSTIELNKQLEKVLKTVQEISKATSNQQIQVPNNSVPSVVPTSQRTNTITPEDEKALQQMFLNNGASLPTTTPVANNTLKEVLVAGLMPDSGYGYYSQTTPKLPDNAFLSPIVGKNLSNIINTKYRPEDSFGKTGGIRFNQNIGVNKNTNIQSSVTGMARLVGNTLEIIKQTKGGTIKLIYEGLNIPAVKKNLNLKDGGSVNINAGQLIGNLAGNNFKFRTEVNSSNVDPLKVIRDIEYKRLNIFQQATRLFDQPNKAVTNLGLLPEPNPVTTSSTPSTPPVNRAINWVKGKVKGFVRQNAPEPVKRVIRNTKNFVDNIPPIIPTYNPNTNSYNPGILDILTGNNSKPNPPKTNPKSKPNPQTKPKPKPKPNNKTGSGINQSRTGSGSGTTPSAIPNLSGAFPPPLNTGFTTVSNRGNQTPSNLSGTGGITLTPVNTSSQPKIVQKQPQVPLTGTPGQRANEAAKRGLPLDPNTNQQVIPEAGKFNQRAKEEEAKANAAKNKADIEGRITDLARKAQELIQSGIRSGRETTSQIEQDSLNTKEYLEGLLIPNQADRDKYPISLKKLQIEYDRKINEQQNIIDEVGPRGTSGGVVKQIDALIKEAAKYNIDVTALRGLNESLRAINKVRGAEAQKNKNLLTKNRADVFKIFKERFEQTEANRDATNRATSLGVTAEQLKTQLDLLKQLQTSDPLNPELLKIPDLEANIARLELTQKTLQDIANLRNEWNQSGGMNMRKDLYDQRMQVITDNAGIRNKIIEDKLAVDKTLAYVNREIGLIDKGATEREPITKGLQLDNSLFAARNKNGLVNIINVENEALIKQRDLMDSYRKTSLETQRDFKLSSDDRITKRLRNAINLQKELDVLKSEIEYQKAAGEIKNRQVTLDIDVRLSDSAKAIFESNSTIKKNLGLELAGERLDRRNAITTQENEYRRKQNETDQFILDNNLTGTFKADELRKNNETWNTGKLREIQVQFSEFEQVIKSFVSGFKSSFKEFLLSTEDTGTALVNLLKGLGRSVLDTLAEIAAKRVTDLLFGWMGGAGLNPATELSFAAQQLTQAAIALQTAAGTSSALQTTSGAGGMDIFSLFGMGGGDSFTPGSTQFSDPSTFAASDFEMAELTGFAKGGMIDDDTLGKIQNFANGGIVGTMNKERAMTGRTPHLVVASEGERILNHKETAIWNKLQSGISGFADGGIVGGGSGDIASRIGSTTTVNVPVSVSVSESSDVDGARLSQTVQALVSDGIRREMRPGGSIRRGNPYGR